MAAAMAAILYGTDVAASIFNAACVQVVTTTAAVARITLEALQVSSDAACLAR